jgi:hypothetical protein
LETREETNGVDEATQLMAPFAAIKEGSWKDDVESFLRPISEEAGIICG